MATAPATHVEPGTVRGLRRVEYDALVATGLLEGEPVELLKGALVSVSPQDPQHANMIRRVARLLSRQLPPGWEVGEQLPLAVSEDSEPEPDVSVVADIDDPLAHPSTAALVVEVARTSQRTDLGVKAGLYAAAGVPDYWVVDLVARTVHVHRDPGPAGYASVVLVSEGELRTTAPLELLVDVGSLLA